MHVLHTTKVGTSWKLVKILHWKESGWNLSLFEYMFYLQPDKFKKPSSKSLLQLPSVGFAWEEGPLWQHCAAEIIIPSSSCLKALFARLADTVGVFFFFKVSIFFWFHKNCTEKVNIFNNCWVRLVVAKSERTERKEGMEASERKRLMRVRWKSWNMTGWHLWAREWELVDTSQPHLYTTLNRWTISLPVSEGSHFPS